MPKIKYKNISLQAKSLAIVDNANDIIAEYTKLGLDLTLRQLYYQFVARDLLENNQQNYKRLGSIINDARLAGYIDWEMIEDRTRGVEKITTWISPGEIVSAVAAQFKIDLWKLQQYRPEVWIEKEALAGVFEGVCTELRIPYLSCRGYTSQSEMWRAGRRLKQHINNKQEPVVFHFGDHDPSGIDMSRDIQERLSMFVGKAIRFERLALNMEQVEEFNPPPNPAKMTDSRSDDYANKFGDESWELDALNPTILADLVRANVNPLINRARWDVSLAEEAEHRRLLGAVSDSWEELTSDL